VIEKLGLELPFTKTLPPVRDRPYETPGQAHGTHVAGILAADWRPDDTDADPLGPRQTTRKPPQPLLGVCPDIEIYDLRVFDRDGRGDEFSVISALQFVRWINQQHETIEIHGVNLSLAMLHEVNNYACGRSPVCDECTRLVGNGVVVVAAAGNAGRSVHVTTDGSREDGYRAISISDPGNAEVVITVGSTHRREPHTYGVSYFSSRGPTGDGRLKPDLVAPGEKITSTVPGGAMAQQDGTSQAAPHVSGAAALLMSRHSEFIGDPERIKRILMDSAIDLGRERHFQGAGLVDIFGAMQSV
jgi:subtilisin family serine protease